MELIELLLGLVGNSTVSPEITLGSVSFGRSGINLIPGFGLGLGSSLG
ncbi:hypothetical protein [Rhodococcus kronopolitis]|uniref:Uncharacterized protein n=1 Tax=Rhodococcus kronopolitis TaxID=1460226 RepID=A0ABV9FXI1_9NOCA